MSQEIIDRGQAAKRLLENPDFVFIAEQVRQDIFTQFVRTNVADAEKRESLFKVVNGLETLVAKARMYASDGDIELTRDASIPDA
ncbi:hypothetical protein KX729_09190 [Rhizobium sp. XQZ8]|uniref:hypothetical protein n=1 Tax=Rhizobium populisoli TaxID=2859785 RepID=UPI001CA581E9|nr:hypothetical protein [Rhizobium populisoli]MBW6421613.1 hypothetical protein [Rhizobium populisoli]